jgi:hypothetical protein
MTTHQGEAPQGPPNPYTRLVNGGFIEGAMEKADAIPGTDPLDWFAQHVTASPYEKEVVDLAIGWWNRRSASIEQAADIAEDPSESARRAYDAHVLSNEYFGDDLASLSSPNVINTFALLEQVAQQQEAEGAAAANIFEIERDYSLNALQSSAERCLQAAGEKVIGYDDSVSYQFTTPAPGSRQYTLSRQANHTSYQYGITKHKLNDMLMTGENPMEWAAVFVFNGGEVSANMFTPGESKAFKRMIEETVSVEYGIEPTEGLFDQRNDPIPTGTVLAIADTLDRGAALARQ